MENNITKTSDTQITITPAPEVVSLTELKKRESIITAQIKRAASLNPETLQKRLTHVQALISQAQALGVKEDAPVVNPS